jgi:hypothetical protein
MPVGHFNLDWLAHNAQRSYPLTAESTKKDTTGTFEIPEDFLVALYLPVTWANNINPASFFVRKIEAGPVGYSLTIGYAANDGDVDVASALISSASHTTNQVYGLGGLGDFADSWGWLQIGSLHNIGIQPAGLWNFDVDGSRLEPDVVRPNLRGVTALQLDNGGELSDELTGVIRLVAGRNFRLTPVLAEGVSPIIVFDAIEGEGLTETCICDDTSTIPIRTLNGITPDSEGNFTFLGNDCMEINSGTHALTFNDVCSEPCCGCSELVTITQALESFGEKATTLENFLVSLEARVTQTDQVILGSRLGDRGCTPATPCE